MVIVVVKIFDVITFLLEVLQKFGSLFEGKVTLATVTTGVLGHFSRIFIVEYKINIHVKHGSELDALFYVIRGRVKDYTQYDL